MNFLKKFKGFFFFFFFFKFFPENVEIIVRRKLRELSHASSIRDYVKQFSRLMLDIRDMSKTRKVCIFIEGLESWVKIKLYE